jgi:hypothetical protein
MGRTLRKIVYLLIVFTLIGSLTVLTTNAQVEERYAVGGEILPVSTATFLFSPWVLALVAIILLAAGGAIYTGAITIEVVK